MTELDDGYILIVDDKKESCEMLNRHLKDHGYVVETAQTDQDALEILAHKSYGAVMLDLSGPGLHGLEVLKKVRQMRPNIQIIVLAEHEELEAGIEALKMGASDFVQKPINFDELLAKINAAENKRHELIEHKYHKVIMKILSTKGW